MMQCNKYRIKIYKPKTRDYSTMMIPMHSLKLGLISIFVLGNICLCSELNGSCSGSGSGGALENKEDDDIIAIVPPLNQLIVRRSSLMLDQNEYYIDDVDEEEEGKQRIIDVIISRSKQPYVPTIIIRNALVSGCQTLVLDLDDCLYKKSSNFQKSHLVPAINDYVSSYVGKDEGARLGYESYLEKGHSVYAINKELQRIGKDPISLEDYEGFLSDWLEEHSSYSLIEEDPKLAKMLLEFKGNVVVFTNSCPRHCKSALEKLGIMSCIDGVVCVNIQHPDFRCKPDPIPYMAVETLLLKAGCPGKIFADDSPANIATSIERGWKSVLIHEELSGTVETHGGAHHQAPLVHCLEDIHNEHWQ